MRKCEEILNYIEEAVAFLRDGIIVDTNKVFKEYFGESDNRDIFDVLVCEKAPLLVEAVHSGKEEYFEDKFFSPVKNTWIYFELRYIPNHEIIILRDVTEKKRLIDSSLNMAVLLPHELKNPISVLGSILSDLLENEVNDENIRKMWEAQKQVKRLVRITEQIEYTAMAQLGLYKPKLEDIDLKRLVREVLDDLEHLRSRKNIEVKLDLKADKLKADKFILRTILRNLLSNALKYSYENSEVQILIDEDHLLVKNNGIGIPEDEIDKVFERFYRTSSGVRMASGSGLGLPVVKYLAQLAGYEVDPKIQIHAWNGGESVLQSFQISRLTSPIDSCSVSCDSLCLCVMRRNRSSKLPSPSLA